MNRTIEKNLLAIIDGRPPAASPLTWVGLIGWQADGLQVVIQLGPWTSSEVARLQLVC